MRNGMNGEAYAASFYNPLNPPLIRGTFAVLPFDKGTRIPQGQVCTRVSPMKGR